MWELWELFHLQIPVITFSNSWNFTKCMQFYYSVTNSKGPLSRFFSFFSTYVHSLSHIVPQNPATSVYQSPIPTSSTMETTMLCWYFPPLTVVWSAFMQIAGETRGFTSCVSHLSEITILHCLLINVCKQLIHIFCPVF